MDNEFNIKPEAAAPKGSNLHFIYAITIALGMIVCEVIILLTGQMQNPSYGYINFLIFILGIVFYCIQYGKSMDNQVTFRMVFGKAFKLVILTTLIMVLWRVASNYIFPEIKEQALVLIQTEMQKRGTLTDDQLEETLKMSRKFYVPSMIFGTILQNLFVGVLGALLGAMFTRKEKQNHPF